MKKIAIVTGASRGIGRACAIKLARQNIQVIANYNKSKDKAEELKNSLQNEGISIDIFKADVTKFDEVKQMIKYTLDKYGKIDILINNARNNPNETFHRTYTRGYRQNDRYKFKVSNFDNTICC